MTAPDHEQAEDYWLACSQPGCRVRLVRRECPAGLCFEHLNAGYLALADQLAEAQERFELMADQYERLEVLLAERERELEDALDTILIMRRDAEDTGERLTIQEVADELGIDLAAIRSDSEASG